MIDRITEQPFCQTRVSGSTFVNADCFDVFPFIADKSVDAIIADLPYGTTANKWDTIIPFDKLWEQLNRVIKPNGAIVLFGSEPFSSALRMSNIKNYKYDWIWDKKMVTGFALAKKQPMRNHENIIVFYQKQPTYNFQKRDVKKPFGKILDGVSSENYGNLKNKGERGVGYPKTIIEFPKPNNLSKSDLGGKHPTQKPISLMEYLIKTYTNKGDIVLDFTMGSGTTNLACIKLDRKSIGIEKEKQYYDVAVRRASEYCH
jgi:site-specific DNA-methyltransferase (adenine-specific)